MHRSVAIALIACGCASSASDGAPATPGNGHGGSDAAGGSGSNLENPTGDCVAPDNGGRLFYHAPDATNVWLPDCQGSLTTDYFRVFAQADGTAYMIPRPDGWSYLAEVCADASHELHAIVEEYELCEPATEETVDLVNAMDPADALAVAHYLNDRVVFVAHADGVSPYVIPTDIVLACQQDEAFRNGPLKDRCDFEIECVQTGVCPSIGWTHIGEEGRILADKMNEMYGIEGQMLCDRLTRDARETLDDAIRQSANSCQVDEDCTTVGRATECHDSCAGIAAVTAQSSIDEARVAIDASTCAAFAEASCPAIVHPPCIPLLAACVDGVCVDE